MDVRKSALIARASTAMFDLIEAAEHYPAFMPWCAAATVLARDENFVVARIDVDYHGARFAITTRNPKRRPHWMGIGLVAGPFQRFSGEWRLTDLAADACRIDFEMSWAMGGSLLDQIAGPIFDGIANSMVDAFARRAEETKCPASAS